MAGVDGLVVLDCYGGSINARALRIREGEAELMRTSSRFKKEQQHLKYSATGMESMPNLMKAWRMNARAQPSLSHVLRALEDCDTTPVGVPSKIHTRAFSCLALVVNLPRSVRGPALSGDYGAL